MEVSLQDLASIVQTVVDAQPYRVVLSKPTRKTSGPSRATLDIQHDLVTIDKVVGTQVIHERIARDAVMTYCIGMLTEDFRNLNAWTASEELIVMQSKKGSPRVIRRPISRGAPEPRTGHDRKKSYVLEEGVAIPPLIDMGVITKDGRVVASMHHKFRQINRFMEQVDDLLRDVDIQEIRAIDFGSGKSYLTFLLYYYLTEVRGLHTKMTGLDLKPNVVASSNAAAEKYGYDGLEFKVADIRDYSPDGPIDLVVSLHACDMATDLALAHAVEWRAKWILSAPCCQHELNGQMKGASSVLTRHGLIQERFAALLTDSIRGDLLEASGYRTQILEFVDPEDSPKNLLFRAVRADRKDRASRDRARSRVDEACEAWAVQPLLYSLLKDNGVLDDNPGYRPRNDSQSTQ